MTWLDAIHVGDCRATMRAMIATGVRVNCIVTSPPYFGLRDYGTATWEGGDPACKHPSTRRGHGDEKQSTSVGTSRDPIVARDCKVCGARRIDSQIGLEASPAEYVETMREVFELARELLADDGTLWLNLGDSYAGSGRGGDTGESGLDGSTDSQDASKEGRAAQRGSQLAAGLHESQRQAGAIARAWVKPPAGFRQKNLLGMPWRVAFALQDAGWNLRQDIIWSKPNPMPESVRDRCTKAHEYLFLLSKSQRYHFDADAIAEPLGSASIARLSQDVASQDGSDRVPGKTNGPMKAVGKRRSPGNQNHRGATAYEDGDEKHRTKVGLVSFAERERERVAAGDLAGTRNARSVWSISTTGFSGAHFATFPRDLVSRCIRAGSRPGDTVFDPFMGSGTVAEVALDLGRHYIGCELNPEYAAMFQTLRSQQVGMGL